MTATDLTELESILSDMESDHNKDDYPCPGKENCSLASAIFKLSKVILRHRMLESGFDDPTQEARIEAPIVKELADPDFPKPGAETLSAISQARDAVPMVLEPTTEQLVERMTS